MLKKLLTGLVCMASILMFQAGLAYSAQPDEIAALLVAPAMELPMPSIFIKILLLLTFFLHLLLVNIVLGSVILAIFDRRASATDDPHAIAFMPKILALAVNFAIAPYLFMQFAYGSFFYPAIVLMAVWWMCVFLLVMLAYYGLYVNDGAAAPDKRRFPLLLVAVLLLCVAFILTNANTLMLRPDHWLQWFSKPGGTLLNLRETSLFPRYLHTVLASIAIGGLTVAWRAKLSADSQEYLFRLRRGLEWFFYASLAQIPVGLFFLFTLPGEIRALFLGQSGLHTITLALIIPGMALALSQARRGNLKTTSAAALFNILVMVLVRDNLREAMLSPYAETAYARPQAPIMPEGQLGGVILFLVCLAAAVFILIWLGRTVWQAYNHNPEIQEG